MLSAALKNNKHRRKPPPADGGHAMSINAGSINAFLATRFHLTCRGMDRLHGAIRGNPMEAIRSLNKPSIQAIHGYALVP
ncbi:hypothetical protein O181_018164 [Austropuccinia psidii MF-1]|uniref:Uncharacterized protein n=1 Tax=Austropuccinia psidii MF-1 TaxID=1389203 RepID=A0A9Q3GTH7_9BASI|nr:hypothetical protein [Austropuccinia psidii MF-1]